MGEVLMFVRENIAQLVGQALGVAYPGIDVGVRMSVYPIVYAAIGDIVLQLYGERHVCLAALKLWVEHTERWYMMGDNRVRFRGQNKSSAKSYAKVERSRNVMRHALAQPGGEAT